MPTGTHLLIGTAMWCYGGFTAAHQQAGVSVSRQVWQFAVHWKPLAGLDVPP